MRKNKNKSIFEQVEVVDAGAKGKTIGKAPDGRVIFMDNTVPGDIVDVQTTKKKKSYFEGKAVRFHTFSNKRTEPVCQHFGVCGGCKWQHMGYEHQLYYKQKEVENNLRRIGHLDLPVVDPILGSQKQFFYRNKMEFSFSDSRWLTQDEIRIHADIPNRNALGFHIPGMWDKILDIQKCHLQEDPSNAIRLETKAFALKNGLAFFNPRKQEGLLRTLMIRTATTGEVMVVVQFYKDNEGQRQLLLDHLHRTFPEITALLYIVNQKQNDSFYDQEVVCHAGRDHIVEEMDGLRFKITAKSFYQTNAEQAHELYKVTRDFAGLTGNELVYDLYTGTGTIAQFVAKKAQKVVGIEAVPEAIAAAKDNAKENQIHNVSFFVGDMKNVFNTHFMAQHGQPEVIITDPPRDGMHPAVVQQILNVAPQRVVYVSCNSATQARDLEMMKDHYKIVRVQPVDMFPQTHHVENVVLLEKKN
jgi:23S rRNA (uracil1939-C5)-methyltransferase